MAQPFRIGFFGLPLAALALARDGHELAFAVLSPVEHVGRRRLRRLLPESHLLDILQPPSFPWEPEVDGWFEQAPPDLVVSWFWTRRLPRSWFARARLGGLGAHPSLLPRHRGPNPFFAAIDAGDATTGVSVHRLSEDYDTGDILATREIEVGDRNAWQLARALDRPSLGALREVVRELAAGGRPLARPQEERDATWAPDPSGSELAVNWSWSTERVLRRLRALSPVPGLALELDELRFFVTGASAARDFTPALAPGEAEFREILLLRTGDGAIGVESAAICTDSEEEPSPVAGKELVDWLRRSRSLTGAGARVICCPDSESME